MATVLPPDLEVSVAIALRMVGQAARVECAGKLGRQRDAGSGAVARALVVQLALQGWEISRPPVPIVPSRSR